ncbi:MAG: efflux RND transporter periplasmic adaptor subunit [Xanthomonadales bacterium]|nr:efflux RND transporter periplasmic adaptor subunit [Xanthomonadales bacterium]
MHANRAWIGLAVMLGALSLVACGGGGGPPEFPPPEVEVAPVLQEAVTEWDQFSGHIEAIDSVELRPRVNGYLQEIHFEEGSAVSKGDLLFSIDAREYQAALDTARADLSRARTRHELAQTEAARAQKLAAIKAISAEELEQRNGEVAQANADIRAAQARVRQAELNVEFSQITAPIDGRIGAALVKPGNLVQAGQSVLTTLVSIDPVYVAFEGDESVYLRYQQLARQGNRPSSRDARNPVRVGLADDEGFPREGEMVFVDNQLDPHTGTIRARALLDNADGSLTPGLFARVQLLGRTGYQAMLIDERAILTDQDRKYVYIIDENNTAQRRDLQLGRQFEGLRVVSSGLQAGDRVVVNGTRKIFFPGAPVQPVEVAMRREQRGEGAAVPVASSSSQ